MRAHADAVGPLPEDCPSGSIGASSHAGNWCTPWLCEERDCELGTTCENTGLCVLEEERECGGQTSGEPCTFTYREAFGPCETDDDCDQGRCVTDDYCVEPTPPDEASSCGCSTGAGASMVFLLGLLPLLGARRQR
jgi:hypothetical protein